MNVIKKNFHDQLPEVNIERKEELRKALNEIEPAKLTHNLI